MRDIAYVHNECDNFSGVRMKAVEYHIRFNTKFADNFPGEIIGYNDTIDTELWTYENHDILLDEHTFLYWYYICQPIFGPPTQGELYLIRSKYTNGTSYLRDAVYREGSFYVGRWYRMVTTPTTRRKRYY